MEFDPYNSDVYAKRRIKELEKEHGFSTKTLFSKIENEDIDENDSDYEEWLFLYGVITDQIDNSEKG